MSKLSTPSRRKANAEVQVPADSNEEDSDYEVSADSRKRFASPSGSGYPRKKIEDITNQSMIKTLVTTFVATAEREERDVDVGCCSIEQLTAIQKYLDKVSQDVKVSPTKLMTYEQNRVQKVPKNDLLYFQTINEASLSALVVEKRAQEKLKAGLLEDLRVTDSFLYNIDMKIEMKKAESSGKARRVVHNKVCSELSKRYLERNSF